MQKIRSITIIGYLLVFLNTNAQEALLHVSSTTVYQFLDELAAIGAIELNSAVKPYSRGFIAHKLDEATQSGTPLTKRQKEEVNFYLKDFNKEIKPGKDFEKRTDLFYYNDSLFTFSINPILGIQGWQNRHGINYHRWNGADVFAYVGRLGIYASLRDNNEYLPMVSPRHLSVRPGARYKWSGDFSEMRGGVTWSWNWGSLGLVKDHFEWGNYIRYPSIFTAKPPSIAHFRLKLNPAKWIDFNYLHGWLVSGVVDSTRSYLFTNSYGTGYREVYHQKFISANLFTFRPMKNFYASIGNSVVYSDHLHPAYMIPFFLYKSVDHTLNQGLTNTGGQNSQFFLDVSTRQIKNLHLFFTLFFDDISMIRYRKNRHLDYYSFKAGSRYFGPFPNMSVAAEYFQSWPLAYKHIVPTTTFESNLYNMGHYLQDNARAFYTELVFTPFRGFEGKIWISHEVRGPDHELLGTDRLEVIKLFLDRMEWKNQALGLQIKYQIINDMFVFGEYTAGHTLGNLVSYTAEFYHGRTNTLSAGIFIGR